MFPLHLEALWASFSTGPSVLPSCSPRLLVWVASWSLSVPVGLPLFCSSGWGMGSGLCKNGGKRSFLGIQSQGWFGADTLKDGQGVDRVGGEEGGLRQAWETVCEAGEVGGWIGQDGPRGHFRGC